MNFPPYFVPYATMASIKWTCGPTYMPLALTPSLVVSNLTNTTKFFHYIKEMLLTRQN